MEKKLKIAIIGYGKMGKAIEMMALKRKHTVGAIIDNEEQWPSSREQLAGCDAAIEFTTPETAPKNIRRCFELDIPVITGTTGWYNDLPAIVKSCEENRRCLFHAANFSIGVNIFFELNRQLGTMLAEMKGYSPRIVESHHSQKLDAPSGTAIALANDIVAGRDNLTKWISADEYTGQENLLPVKSYRLDDVTGTHVVLYESKIDTIEIKHSSHDRSGFAEGAILAAEWVYNRQGVFTMKDMLNI